MTVFLSHSTKDADFVEKLAFALEASGFTPWRCEVDIEKGANFVSRINEGLAQSQMALLVWSQHAANSAWTLEEWTAALARQVEENRIRLGIVLLRGCPMPLPPLLRTKNYTDARADEGAGIRETLQWLKGRQRVQRHSGLRAPVYLPDYRPQDFVGRSAYLTRLQDTLTAEPGVFLLYGEPGAGKSMLALKFAWEAQKDFDAVVFQTCGDRSIDAITAELAERLPIDVKTRPPEEQRAAAKAWLRERQSLLVLDDVWSAEVQELAPGPPCSVLHTSRKHSLPWIPPKQSAEVEKFTEAEAEELFHTYLDSVFGESEVARNCEALLRFARRVEMLPIAVAVGASLLREKSASALGRAVLKLRLDALTDGSKDVNALFGTAIASQPEREQKLLAAGAVCVPEGFWLPLAAEIAELSEDDAEDAADRLVHSSLLRVIDRERRRFNLHALLRDAAATTAPRGGDALRNLQKRHAAILEKLFKDWETRWQECRECLEEILPAARFRWERGESAREAALSMWGYFLAGRIGEMDVALRIMKEQEVFCAGRDDRDAKFRLQVSYGNQAVILKGWGKLEEALALHRKKEAICLELGDKDGLAASYGNQAGIMQMWGRLDEAMVLHGKGEAICEELGSKDGLQASYGNQALILQDWGRLEEAMALHKKEEAIAEELGNKDQLQRSYGNQALILIKQNRLKEAEILLQKSEAICLELGLRRDLGFCYGQWGLLARAQGDRKTEKQKLEQAFAIFTELKMPRQRDAAQADLGRVDSG